MARLPETILLPILMVLRAFLRSVGFAHRFPRAVRLTQPVHALSMVPLLRSARRAGLRRALRAGRWPDR